MKTFVLDRLVATPQATAANRIYRGQRIEGRHLIPSTSAGTILDEQVERDGADGVQTDTGRVGRRAERGSGAQWERIVDIVDIVGVVVEHGLPEREREQRRGGFGRGRASTTGGAASIGLLIRKSIIPEDVIHSVIARAPSRQSPQPRAEHNGADKEL